MEPAPADTRTALLQAALVCFAEHGFDGTSIRMIANRASRPLSLLAHHFGNKEGLYLEVFKFLFESTMGTDRVAKHPRDRAEAECMLGQQVRIMFQDVVQKVARADAVHEYGSILWLREIRSPRPVLAPLLQRFMQPTVETVRASIRILRPELTDAEVDFTGVTIIGQITGHGLMHGLNQVIWTGLDPHQDPDLAVELLVRQCLHGLLDHGASPAEAR